MDKNQKIKEFCNDVVERLGFLKNRIKLQAYNINERIKEYNREMEIVETKIQEKNELLSKARNTKRAEYLEEAASCEKEAKQYVKIVKNTDIYARLADSYRRREYTVLDEIIGRCPDYVEEEEYIDKEKYDELMSISSKLFEKAKGMPAYNLTENSYKKLTDIESFCCSKITELDYKVETLQRDIDKNYNSLCKDYDKLTNKYLKVIKKVTDTSYVRNIDTLPKLSEDCSLYELNNKTFENVNFMQGISYKVNQCEPQQE